MIGLLEMLATRSFEPRLGPQGRVKLCRHTSGQMDIETLRNEGLFEVYHKYQEKREFDNCDHLVVFIGETQTTSRFIGVYDVGSRLSANSSPPLPEKFPDQGYADKRHYYQLEKRYGFEDFEDRLVIDWGKAPKVWSQWFTDRPVLEIRPVGRALPPFRDYLHVNLSFDDLVRLVARPDAHRDWLAGLSAVGAIYLIVDGITGEQYVGSATGSGGLWQRWNEYAKSGHGENVRLKELCERESAYPGAFRFSILETFSRTLSRAEAINAESFFKGKLGTRAFGLNSN